MASAEQYAAWIVANAKKRGTREFEVVAKAYQEAKALQAAPKPAPKKEDRSIVGRAYDAVFGEPEAPKPYTASELQSRQGTIAERRASLLTQAAQLEARAKITPGRIDRGPDQAQALRDGAQRARAEAAALGRELAAITKTGMPVPEASYIREPLSAAAREAYTAVSSFPGVVAAGLGRGLGAVGLPGAEFLKEKSAKYLANVEKAGEYVAGAEGEGVQYDATAKLLTDVAGGAGSMAALAGPGGVARLTGAGRGLTGAARAEAIAKAALPGQYAVGMGQGAQQGVEDIRAYEQETGKAVPDLNAFAAILLNAGLGAAEVGVFNKLVERLPVAQRGAAMEKVAETVRRVSKGKVDPTAVAKAVGKELTEIEASAVGRVAVRGGAEAAQEGGVQAGSNLIAQQLYDKDRDLTEGVGRAALVGGIVGGGVRSVTEAKNYLGERAAKSRQEAINIIADNEAVTGTYDINVPNKEDPTQQNRVTVQTMGLPDADGNILVMQPGGIPTRMNVDDLERMRVPTEGFRATQVPETLSKQNVEARLVQALGNTAPDEDAESYIQNVSSKLNKGMAAGKPDDIDAYIEKQKKAISKARISEDAKIARMLVLDEAAKARDEYLELLTAPPEGTAPARVEEVAEAPTEQVAPAPTTTIAEEVEQNAAEREAAAQEREEIFRSIAENPDIIDKMGTFADRLAAKGLDAPDMRESTSLRDIVRRDSELETTAARVEDIHARERMVARMNVIEPIIYDPDIKGENKQKKINADLKRRNMEPLTPDEIDRVYGFEAAQAVFGPEGEFQQRIDKVNAKRDAALERIMRDPAIKDKYRAFIGQVDKNNWDAPNEQEMAALRGDTAELEGLIQERAPTVPAEVKQAITAREQELLSEEPEYDTHPDIVALDQQFSGLTNDVYDVDTYPKLTKLVRDLEQGGILGEGDVESIRAAVRVAEGPYKFDAARQETLNILDRIRDEQTTDVVQRLNTEFTQAARAQAEQEVMAAQEQEAAPVTEEVAPEAEPVVEAPVAEEVVQEPVQEEAPVAEEVAPIVEPAPVAEEVAPVVEPAPAPVVEEVVQEPVQQEAPAAPVAAPAPAAAPAPTPAPAAKPDVITASPLPDGPPATPSNPRIETLGFAAENQARFKKFRSKLIRKFNYKYQDAVDYTRALASIYGVTKLPPNLDVAHKFELLESRKIGNQMSLRRWYLDPLENKIKELELDPQDVDMYLWARSAKDRNAMVRKSSKGEITDGSGMSDVDADMVLNELALRGLTPKLRQVAKIHDALVDFMGKQRVETGMLSKDAWKKMRKEQPFYTPLKGFALNGDMLESGDINEEMAEAREAEARGGGGTRIREYIAPRGRKSMPSSPIANLQHDAQMAIARIERNRVSQAFLDAVLNDPVSHANVVKVYSGKKVDGTTQLFSDGARKAMAKRVTDNPKAADRVFLAKKDGEAFYLDFQNTDAGNALFRAFANMSPQEIPKYLAPIQTVSNGIKSLKTRFNPSYLLGTAWQRDFQEAIMTNLSAQGIKGGPAEGKKIAAKSAGYMFQPLQAMIIRNYLNGKDPSESNLVSATKFGATPEQVDEMALLFDQFLRDGGAVGNSMIMDTTERMQTLQKALKRYEELTLLGSAKARAGAAAEVAKIPFEFMDAIAQVMDMQARFATYRAALDENISRDDAASLALDSSLNLTRRGELAPVLDAWSFFFSAGVEGGRKFVKQGLTSRNARKIILAAVKLGILVQLWNYFTSDDDDEDGRKNIYDVSDATRQSRTVLYYGPGTNDYVAIPMAFSLGFAKYAGEQFAAAMLDDISPMEAAVTTADAFRNMTLPIRGSAAKDLGASALSIGTPDIVQPFIDLYANTNFFGGKIYRENKFGNTPPSELGREDTAEAWKWIAQGANSLTKGTSTVAGGFSRAPEWYEYLATQLGGGLANFSGDVLSLKVPDLFKVTGKGGEYAPMSNFYENTDKMDAIYPTYKKVNGSPDADEAPEYDETDEAALAENQEQFPLQTQPEIMEAYGEATKRLKEINKAYREGDYADIEDKYADMNEVYKEFNRTFNEVKKRK